MSFYFPDGLLIFMRDWKFIISFMIIILMGGIFPGCLESDEIHFELIILFIPNQETEFDLTLPGLLLQGNISMEFIQFIEKSNIEYTSYKDNNDSTKDVR